MFLLDMGEPVRIKVTSRWCIWGLSLRDAAHPDGDIEPFARVCALARSSMKSF